MPSRITAVSAKKQRELAQRDQARALPRLVALRDPVTDHDEDRRRSQRLHFRRTVLSRSSSDGWDGRDPSLTADEAGQLEMMQIVLVGLGAGAAAALLFASVVVRIDRGGLSVLSRAAADPDRRARLEPHGRADRRGLGHRRGRSPVRRLLHRRARGIALSARGGSAIWRCSRDRRRTAAAARSNGIRSAGSCCGRQ